MLTDLVLAIAHHICVFALAALIAAEFALLQPDLGGTRLQLLSRLDALYGVAAAAVIAVGIARLHFGPKGEGYYLANPWFWAKMASFAAIGLLSVGPTLAFLRWRRALRWDKDFAPQAAAIGRARAFVLAELVLLSLVLASAAAMARFA